MTCPQIAGVLGLRVHTIVLMLDLVFALRVLNLRILDLCQCKDNTHLHVVIILDTCAAALGLTSVLATAFTLLRD